VGDAAHLVNASFYHEGTNLAMASGLYAAETIIEAKEKEDFSAQTLKRYQEKLNNSFVMKDLRKYRAVEKWSHENPKFFKEYPDVALDMLKDYFSISEMPKETIQKEAYRKVRAHLSPIQAFLELNKFRKTFF
jgi:electron transfer flavoprotein-quinone oxidoreductase